MLRILAAAVRLIANNKLLFAGLGFFLGSVLVVSLPVTRDLWFQIWSQITRTPVAVPQALPDLQAVDGSACLTCHTDSQKKLAMATVHKPFADLQCATCHTGHDPQTFQTRLVNVDPATGDQSRLCGSCHDVQQYLGMSNIHVPFKNAWCTACHDPHASDVESATNAMGVTSTNSLLKVHPSQICLNCHNMNLRYGLKKVQHPPFQMKACLGCHVPHASNNPKNTRLPLPYLCMNCHAIVARDMSLAVLHPPFSQAWCTMCHNPHATDYPRMAKAPEGSPQPFVDLCLQCHQAQMARLPAINLHVSHPMGKSQRTGQDVVAPLTGNQLACISCHHPHGSNNPRMWRRDKDFLCLGCHRQLKGRFNMPW